MNKVTIYSLIDPRTGETKYIGWTAKPLEQRLTAHLRDPRSSRMGQWFRELQQNGTIPLIRSLEIVEWQERYSVEEQWIKRVTGKGTKLLNWIHNKSSWR